MAANELDDGEGINGINVTPLVDIILVLLVIFMVTTTTIQQVEGMEVDKPDAATGQAVQDLPKSILLVCHTDGRFVVDGSVMSDDAAIVDAIRAKAKDNPEIQGIVQCDEGAKVGSMVHLIDLLRANGVKKYAIATEKPSEENSASKG
ncbi:MAG: ExbD/TolR family protein [Nannocystaceae bacterium]